jgi:hypothetical protein
LRDLLHSLVAAGVHRKVAADVRARGSVPIKKVDEELQVVWGEVYPPDVPDSQGDFMTRETIREMAWGFMKKQALDSIDVQHCQEKSGSYVVESFIARDDDSVFIPGSWVLGVHVPDPAVWQMVKSGELNGFSIDGFGFRTMTKLEIEIPDVLEGETEFVAGHKHGFMVKFGEDGSFLGGRTTEAEDGHWHEILRGTLTEEAAGHAHRFSFVEGVLDAQAAA